MIYHFLWLGLHGGLFAVLRLRNSIVLTTLVPCDVVRGTGCPCLGKSWVVMCMTVGGEYKKLKAVSCHQEYLLCTTP